MPTTSLILFAVATVASSGRLLDFAVCIARNSELFCHFTLCETGVLAGLFNGESQVHTSFRLGSRILYSTFSRMSRT